MISVIVPVYNTVRYLERCIDSVTDQSDPDWELILIDDGSDDGSYEICKKYSNKDPRIKLLHQENSGQVRARQKGIAASAGEYIVFLDSDDLLEPDAFEILTETANRYNADMVCAGHQRIYEDGGTSPVVSRHEDIVCLNAEDKLRQFYHTRYISGGVWGKLYKRKLFEGVRFDERLVVGEDLELVLKLLLKAECVAVTSRICYSYFLRKNSASFAGFDPRYTHALKNYYRKERFVEKNYPSVASDARGFYTEFEMAAITAMCRNNTYDRDTIKLLQKVLLRKRKDVAAYKNTALYFKICAFMIMLAPGLFIALFRPFHLMTGR